ncbi:F-box only protein 39-like [Biomphalaria glabrata]|uniref:F-box only protein 39-like n=1 Tax=Biomphalaria glabrata TaxID=6526 RepID=A0A9W3BF55_BIOGL|nr:F-box only protein 39-like [Biomphalaria glabrata]
MSRQRKPRPPKAEEKEASEIQSVEACFSRLPIEIVIHVFTFLRREDLVRAMSVCTSWKCLILNSPSLWRVQTFDLHCSSGSTRKVDLLFCAQNFGRHCRTLSLTCRHPGKHECKIMAIQFKLVLEGWSAAAITSFKVSGLRMGCTSNLVVKSICSAMTRMFSRNRPLQVFEMPSAHWSFLEGRKVLNAVFRKSRNTLETLSIEDYFLSGLTVNMDWLSTHLSSLTKLTKLSINLFYLTDESVVSLARARKGELKHLSLWANYVTPWTPRIPFESWNCLTKACRNMEVEFNIVGNVIKPNESLPAIMDSVLPVASVKIEIRRQDFRADGVLRHIKKFYWKQLQRLELDLHKKTDYFDELLIKLVKKCPRLVHVKVSASYRSKRTISTVHKIVKERLQMRDMSDDQPNKKACTDNNAVNIAPRFEDPVEEPYCLQRAAPRPVDPMEGQFGLQHAAPRLEDPMEGQFGFQHAAPRLEDPVDIHSGLQHAAPRLEDQLEGQSGLQHAASRLEDPKEGQSGLQHAAPRIEAPIERQSDLQHAAPRLEDPMEGQSGLQHAASRLQDPKEGQFGLQHAASRIEDPMEGQSGLQHTASQLEDLLERQSDLQHASPRLEDPVERQSDLQHASPRLEDPTEGQ